MTKTLFQHSDDLFITLELFWGRWGGLQLLLQKPWQWLSCLLTGTTQFMSLAAETPWEKTALIIHQSLGLTKAIKEAVARANLPRGSLSDLGVILERPRQPAAEGVPTCLQEPGYISLHPSCSPSLAGEELVEAGLTTHGEARSRYTSTAKSS